jgi:hypothetical protein
MRATRSVDGQYFSSSAGQTYAHVLKNDDREAAEQAASFLLGSAWDDGSQDG